MRLRSVMFQVHLWLGLSLGLYLAVMGLTGSLLIFAEPIDHELNRHLHEVEPTSAPQPFDRALRGFRRRYPQAAISRIRMPQRAGQSVGFWINGWSASLKQIYVDPYTGEVLGERWLLGSVTGFARYLHFNLLGGGWGWLINGYLGLATTLLLASGLWLWWPRTRRQLKQRLWVKWRSTPYRVNWDLHNAVGAWTLLPLTVLALSGAAFAFHGPVKAMVGQFFAFSETKQIAETEGAAAGRVHSLDALVAAAEQSMPGSRVFEVRWDRQGGEPLTAYLWPKGGEPWNQWARVKVDARSARVLSVHRRRTGGDQVMAGILPLHAGTYGGLPVKVLYFTFGLIPAALLVTGLIMYLKRTIGKRRRRKRRLEVRSVFDR